MKFGKKSHNSKLSVPQENFVVKMIKNRISQREILRTLKKKYNISLGRSSIQFIANKFGINFLNQENILLSKIQKNFVIKCLKSGDNKHSCQTKFTKKFLRRIHVDTIKRIANINNISLNHVPDTENYNINEKAILKGFWLVGTPDLEMKKQLKTRSLMAMKDKIKYMKRDLEINETLREEIREKILNGENIRNISKEYGIAQKYLNEYSRIINEDQVEMTNLKKWENKNADEILDLMQQAQEKLRNLESEQKEANTNIKTKAKYIAISFPSDFHLENINTDLAQLRKDFKIIRETPNFYMGFGGDLIDNWTIGPHKEGIRESVIPPKAARIAAGKLFDTIKGKVLWTIRGCHDSWDRNFADYDLPEHISRKLKVPYLGHGGDINLKINEIEYYIHARHKYSGGSRQNGTGCCKNILRDIDSKYDLIAVSHNHISEIKLEHFLGKLRCYVRTGSYKTEDDFSKSLGYVSNEFNQQIPVVILNTKNKEMKIASGINNASGLLKALNRN